MLFNISIATADTESSFDDANLFVIVRFVPLDDGEVGDAVRNETVRLSELRSGWLVKVDDASYRVEVLLPDGGRLTTEVRKGEPQDGERKLRVAPSRVLPPYTLDNYQPLFIEPGRALTGQNGSLAAPSKSITTYYPSFASSDGNKRRVTLRFKEADDAFGNPFGGTSVEYWRGEVETVWQSKGREAAELMLFEAPAVGQSELIECLFGTPSTRFQFGFSRGEPGSFFDAVERAETSSAHYPVPFDDWSHEALPGLGMPSDLRQTAISVRTQGTSLLVPTATRPSLYGGFGDFDSLNIDLVFEAARVGIGRFESGQSLAVRVQTEDPLLGSVLGFMQAGEVRAAYQILKAASDMLYHKFRNPWAAAAGAHVLLGAYSSDEDAEWHGWVENLTDYFPRITDGGIVLAALVLRRARGLRRYGNVDGIHSVAQAKKLCMRALSYGVPLFSASVRLLLENVTLVAGLESNVSKREKQKTQRLLGYARWLATRADPYQPFAVWTIPHSNL